MAFRAWVVPKSSHPEREQGEPATTLRNMLEGVRSVVPQMLYVRQRRLLRRCLGDLPLGSVGRQRFLTGGSLRIEPPQPPRLSNRGFSLRTFPSNVVKEHSGFIDTACRGVERNARPRFRTLVHLERIGPVEVVRRGTIREPGAE